MGHVKWLSPKPEIGPHVGGVNNHCDRVRAEPNEVSVNQIGAETKLRDAIFPSLAG